MTCSDFYIIILAFKKIGGWSRSSERRRWNYNKS